jgi:hypothetical protein
MAGTLAAEPTTDTLGAVSDTAFFTVLDDDPAVGRVRAASATAGPWSPRHQHGGPPTALLVRAAERLVVAGGRADLQAVRVAVDFVGAVPVAELEVRARVVRSGRSAVLVDSELVETTAEGAPGRTCLRAATWLVRRAPEDQARTPHVEHPPLLPSVEPRPAPEDAPPFETWEFPYAAALAWRVAAGDPDEPGPAAAWATPRIPLVAGETPSGLAAVCLVADSGSGISRELSWYDWSFANVDLTVHLVREPVGPWLLLDARSHLQPDGHGTTESTVSDGLGVVARATQALVVQALPSR